MNKRGYSSIKRIADLDPKLRKITIQVNYKRLGSDIFKAFANEAKKERNEQAR